MDFEITKKQKLYEVNNEKCHNYYYLIYGKIYNENKTRFRKFKFVDMIEYYKIGRNFEYE